MNTITAAEVKERLARGEALHMIDVREDEEVAQGMIPGAKHIPLGELPARQDEIARGEETILVCRSGNRSARAYEYLQACGFRGLKNMTGGMLAWDQLEDD